MRRITTVIALLIVLTMVFSSNCKAAETPYIDYELYPYVEDICKEYNICPELVAAQIYRESRWQPTIINDDGTTYGLMQINPKYQQERMQRLGVTNLLDAKQNILVGVDYLSELISVSEGDVYLTLMLYNMKHNSANKQFNAGNYSDYATETCALAESFERSHGK